MNDDFSGPTGTGVWPGKIERMRVTLQKAKSWGRPCRPGDKFPWEASVTTDLKVVYRKRSTIKLWDSSGSLPGFFPGRSCLKQLRCQGRGNPTRYAAFLTVKS